jgi:uncharacterized OsmC-like protein
MRVSNVTLYHWLDILVVSLALCTFFTMTAIMIKKRILLLQTMTRTAISAQAKQRTENMLDIICRALQLKMWRTQ